MTELQEKILYIAKYLDKFCKDNSIEYFLMGGSALGAMRHGGFIPWDDDLDIFMTYDNYHRFIELFEKKGDKDTFFLEKEDTKEWPLYISQLCLKGTTMINAEFKNNMDKHHNVFVDIMCLYSAPERKVLRYMQYASAQWLRVNALEKTKFMPKNKYKKIVLKVSLAVVNPITKKIFIKHVRHYEKKDAKYAGHYFGRARFKNCAFPKEYIGKQRFVKFEDTEFPVFEKVEEYLRMRYGDKWFEMPDKKTRDMYPNHGEFVDLNKDYTEYMSPDRKVWILPEKSS